MSSVKDPFEQYERETPEAKLELIGGRLIIGNGLAGSRYYLHKLLNGWGTEAVLPFAAPDQWRASLQQTFGSCSPPDIAAPLKDWRAWAETVTYDPRLAPAGPMATDPHHFTRERLQVSLWHACSAGHFGTSLGHDFVMQLGNDGFTPDGLLIGRQATERLFHRYLHGPADLVWEVLLPGHEPQDREVKLHAYEAGGVPHYWVVDPEARTIDFFSLLHGKYQRETPDGQGRYRPAGMPGLAFWPDRLWRESDVREEREERIFQVETALPAGWSFTAQEGIGWDDLPFVSRPGLEPMPVFFEEFAAWCPRAKFEGDGRRITIGGRFGTRNVLGMLLRTFGLNETVAVLHPRLWVAGLVQVVRAQRNDVQRKAHWWDLARRAATILRARCGAQRIVVIGSLTRSEPLDYWSQLSLVVWNLKGDRFDNYRLLRKLDPEGAIDLIDPKHATRAEQQMIAENAIEIP